MRSSSPNLTQVSKISMKQSIKYRSASCHPSSLHGTSIDPMQYSPISWSSSGVDARSDAPQPTAFSRFRIGNGIAIVKDIITEEPSVSEKALDLGRTGMSSSSCAGSSGADRGGGVGRKYCLIADNITEDARSGFCGRGSTSSFVEGGSVGRKSVTEKG